MQRGHGCVVRIAAANSCTIFLRAAISISCKGCPIRQNTDFLEAFSNNMCLVTRCIIMLKVSNWVWMNCTHISYHHTVTTSLHCLYQTAWLYGLMLLTSHSGPSIHMRHKESGFVRTGDIFLLLSHTVLTPLCCRRCFLIRHGEILYKLWLTDFHSSHYFYFSLLFHKWFMCKGKRKKWKFCIAFP